MGINMQIPDWIIVIVLLAIMTYAVIATRKYNRNVADFLAAGRCARKYVLGVAEGLSCVGAITVVAWFEMFYNGGFSVAWWGIFAMLVQVLVAMSGWVAYRYRQTRALTLAQILETRYSRNFRIFSGLIIFISGVINFGIFPAVAGRFFQYFWGIEPYMYCGIDLVYAGIMLALTIIALFFVFAGGQITIMITDFIQGTFASICLVVIVVFILFCAVPWEKVTQIVGLRDSNPIETVAMQKSELPDYGEIIKKGTEKGIKRSEKFILSSTVSELEWTKVSENTEGTQKFQAYPIKQTLTTKAVERPKKIISEVKIAKGYLLPGTSYTTTFTYQAPKGFYLIVMDPKARIESACIRLPESPEPREITVSFNSTNIGYANLYFATNEAEGDQFKIGNTNVVIDQVAGQSMFNPFTSSGTKDFNVWFFLIQALTIFWTYKAWQGTQGYYGAAINAHEARMGGVIGNWRIMSQQMLVLIIPLAAYAVLYGTTPEDQKIAENVTQQMAMLPSVTMQGQLRTTLVLTQLLPIGLLGAFSAFMLAAFIGTNGTYMHSWGSIFIQDVIMPFRSKDAKPLTPQQHFNYLRIAIAGVGIFAFFFSLFFEQNSAIQLFFSFTGNLWMGGAGAVIALGLYWKYGTTKGAYIAIFTGIILAIAGQIFGDFLKNKFNLTQGWYNEQWMMLFSMILSTILYVVVSFIDGKGKAYNLDKLLHRGEYATEDSTEEARHSATNEKKSWSFSRMIGIDSDFSFLDKILYTFVTCWVFVWGGIFAIGAILHYSGCVTLDHWISFWHFYVLLSVILGIITTIWFTIGGIVDMKDLLYRLKTMQRNEHDDGEVEK